MPGRRGMPARGWIALGGAAVFVSAVIVTTLAVNGSPNAPQTSTSAASIEQPKSTPLPDLGGPRSRLVPEMTLPLGAKPYSGKQPTPPGFEFWEVPGGRHDLVTQMRSELPTHAALNGMPWCGEVNDSITSWAWGFPADTIGVSFIDGGVMITRAPQPKGCHP